MLMKEQIEMFEIALMCPHQPLAVTNEKVDFFFFLILGNVL